MSYTDYWILGLLIILSALMVFAAAVLIAIVENLKDVKAYQFTVIDRLGQLDQQIRDGNLRILKCLRGESYAGSFGDLDIHTDSSMPSGTAITFSPKQFRGATEER